MCMSLSRGSVHFPVIDISRTGSVTRPQVRGVITRFHSARTAVTTIPRHFQEQKRGENVQPRLEISARRGGAYKRLSDAEYQDKLRKGPCFSL
uniref:Putative ovule protein n=1 Tax=Solanum chacoense TaxID=4108 RepID=A0A0V0GTQ1_SOLCH